MPHAPLSRPRWRRAGRLWPTISRNTTNATNYIATLIASVNVMYERDLNLRLVAGTTILRTGSDPWTVMGSGAAAAATAAAAAAANPAKHTGATRDKQSIAILIFLCTAPPSIVMTRRFESAGGNDTIFRLFK